MKLDQRFYMQNDVVSIAKSLLGCTLYVNDGNETKTGIIVETEAYSYKEKGCHAYNYKRTNRTEVMFQNGGVAYVYLCYGIHQLFNVVTNVDGIPEAVLIRAIQPFESVQKRDNKILPSGPGKLTKVLGINKTHNGISLEENAIWIEKLKAIDAKEIIECPRIGIDYAEDDALLPWRFYIRGNKYVSKPKS